MSRQEKIVKTSIIGIIVNLILVAFKATIGILVNSIAITLDAVNNLTDALSSIITIIGAKLSRKAPDKNHPYGYGRIEYFSSVIIAAIVLWAGITAFMESWPKIFNPDVTSYTTVSLVIIAVAVVVKYCSEDTSKVLVKTSTHRHLSHPEAMHFLMPSYLFPH